MRRNLVDEGGAAPSWENAELICSARAPLSSLFTSPPVICAYLGSGLQMFMAAVMLTWLPTYFKEAYRLPVERAGGAAARFVLLVGLGNDRVRLCRRPIQR